MFFLGSRLAIPVLKKFIYKGSTLIYQFDSIKSRSVAKFDIFKYYLICYNQITVIVDSIERKTI